MTKSWRERPKLSYLDFMELKNPRHRATAICVHEGKLLVVRLRDPSNGREYRLPPGGMIEASETAAYAAVREAREETGYELEVDEESRRDVRYDFDWGGRVFDCDTSFFIARLVKTEPGPTVPDEFVIGVEWMDVAGLESELAYHPVLQATIVEMVFTKGLKP